MRTPKLSQGTSTGWYRYYAGFSEEFVADALTLLDLEPGAVVVDPWHGSGTTGAAAVKAGLQAVGIDANPALVLVARGRILGAEVGDSLPSLLDEIVLEAGRLRDTGIEDPLSSWFEVQTAQMLRGLEMASYHLLVDHDVYRPIAANETLTGISSLAAFIYVALFEVTKALVAPFRTSNPTWVRFDQHQRKVEADWPTVTRMFKDASMRLASALHTDGIATHTRARFEVGDATNLPLGDTEADGAITSPPYLTRIDYVVATRPELAILGYGRRETQALRAKMLGTPTIGRSALSGSETWGSTALNLADRIATHESRASSTYYLRCFQQYFDGLARSVSELRRVVKPGGKAFLVVQDSHYKEIRVDLAQVVSDMARISGWSEATRLDFATRRTLARVNPMSRRYRQDFLATESVVTVQ